MQVADAKRCLKWTYAYGYFLEDPRKVKELSFLQSRLEAETEDTYLTPI